MTLMELLVVIAIIGILAGLLLPAVGAARRRAHRLRSQIEVKMIADAFWSYELDYESWPVRLVGYDDPALYDVEDFTTGIEVTSNVVTMFKGGFVSGMNPSRNEYLAVHRRRHLRADGAFADPWGNPYKYMCDFNGDDVLHIWFTDQQGEINFYDRGVAVWSRGADGSDRDGDHADDVISW